MAIYVCHECTRHGVLGGRLNQSTLFRRILVFYNPTSVMSLGVMALLFFIPTTAILTVICCRKLVVRILP